MSLSRKEIFALVLALSLGLVVTLPHIAQGMGAMANAMCQPVDPSCGACGMVRTPKGCIQMGPQANKFMCPNICWDDTSGFKTFGTCIAPGKCEGKSTTGKDGFGLDQVAKILGDLMGKLMQSGKDSGQQQNPTPTTPASPPTCNLRASIISSNASSTTARLDWQTFSYSSSGSTYDPSATASITPNIGTVEQSGSRQVTVSSVTTYTMTVTSAGGTGTCSDTVVGLGGDDGDPICGIFGCEDDDDTEPDIGSGGTITASPTSGFAPLTVGLHAEVDDEGAYFVDFGDDTEVFEITLQEGLCHDGTFFGTCGLQLDVQHVFEAGGAYTVRLLGGSGASCVALTCDVLDSATVNVAGGTDDDDDDEGSTSFSASPTSGTAPLTVTFSHYITGQGGAVTLSYGDGTSETASTCNAPADVCTSPGTNTHTYTTPGTYTATLSGGASPISITVSASAATTTQQVPVFSNPAFLLPGVRGDIQTISSGGIVTAGFRDPTKNTEISGFYGSYTFNAQPQGIVSRLCQARPWSAGFLSYIVPATFFDSLCVSRGYQVGQVAQQNTTNAPTVTTTQTVPKALPQQPVQPASTTAPTTASARIWAVPATVPLGSRTSIFWTSQGVTSCLVTSPDGSFSQTGLSGGASTVPITAATTYSISCLAANGAPVTAFTTVTISI